MNYIKLLAMTLIVFLYLFWYNISGDANELYRS